MVSLKPMELHRADPSLQTPMATLSELNRLDLLMAVELVEVLMDCPVHMDMEGMARELLEMEAEVAIRVMGAEVVEEVEVDKRRKLRMKIISDTFVALHVACCPKYFGPFKSIITWDTIECTFTNR